MKVMLFATKVLFILAANLKISLIYCLYLDRVSVKPCTISTMCKVLRATCPLIHQLRIS